MNRYAEKLEEGMVFKNYKTLCDHLGEPTTQGGKSRKNHEDKWMLGFKWEKEGQKYLITEVPERELVFKNVRNTVFKEVMGTVILNILAKSKRNPYLATRKHMTTEVGLVNPAFHAYQADPELRAKYAIENQYMFFSIDDYFIKANNNNRNRLKLVLDALAVNKYLLTWKNAYIFIKFNEHGTQTIRPTTEEEEHEIRDLTRATLNKFKYADINEVFRRGEQEQFYQALAMVINEKFDIYGYYPVISINYNYDLVMEYLQDRGSILSDEELEFAKQRLNDITVDRIIQLTKHDVNNPDNENGDYFTNTVKGDRREEYKAIKKYGRKLMRALPDYYNATVNLTELTIRRRNVGEQVKVTPKPEYNTDWIDYMDLSYEAE